ncbi:MAG: MazG nucleotide pyrophosphohydrolase domain-containing protein [Rikenellaceae bacterium]
MTIKEAQELIEAWTARKASRRKGELTNMAVLTEQVGELARVIAQKHSEPSISPKKIQEDLNSEVGDVLWALISIANQANIDLTRAIIDNFEKKETSKE